MNRLLEAQENWYRDRPTMDADNTPRRLLDLLCGEIEELCQAAGEGELTGKDFEQELADVLLFTLALYRSMGVDPEESGLEKMSFNLIRNPASLYRGSMDFSDARKWSKEREKRLKLKEEFYGS